MTILSATVVAAYLGVLCAISPCPLATNIAAVGFVSRGLSPARTLLGGLLYAAGGQADLDQIKAEVKDYVLPLLFG